MMEFTLNNEKDVENALSYLDSEERIIAEINSDVLGYCVVDLFYESDRDIYTIFDKCDIEFTDVNELEDYIIRYYHL
jgi:hypothetical protein